MSARSRYSAIIERLFLRHYTRGATEVPFRREEMVKAAAQLGVELPKNLGDLVYSFRYRADLPKSISSRAPKGTTWIIRPAGRGLYCFVAVKPVLLSPNANLSETKIPDATPGIIEAHALNDEQALLAKVRYNRLVDVFMGTTCYSLQSHLRTAIKGVGQIETDELYIGLDRHGAQYVFPVQAKGPRDRLSVVQIEQDVALCREKFPALVCRPIGAQFVEDDLIAMFELEATNQVRVVSEKHYRLVAPESISQEDLRLYRQRLGE
jgi:hypothetical protein